LSCMVSGSSRMLGYNRENGLFMLLFLEAVFLFYQLWSW
jgi:hypothetical protein